MYKICHHNKTLTRNCFTVTHKYHYKYTKTSKKNHSQSLGEKRRGPRSERSTVFTVSWLVKSPHWFPSVSADSKLLHPSQVLHIYLSGTVLTSNERSFTRMSPLGVTRGTCSNLLKRKKRLFHLSSHIHSQFPTAPFSCVFLLFSFSN